MTGKCVDLPPPDGGTDSGIIVPPMDDGGGMDDATAGNDGGGDDSGANDFQDAGKSSGCGCRTAEGGDDNALALVAGIGLLAVFVGRRRRRS
jgi:MYXO-CTERM domain-containing protein